MYDSTQTKPGSLLLQNTALSVTESPKACVGFFYQKEDAVKV